MPREARPTISFFLTVGRDQREVLGDRKQKRKEKSK